MAQISNVLRLMTFFPFHTAATVRLRRYLSNSLANHLTTLQGRYIDFGASEVLAAVYYPLNYRDDKPDEEGYDAVVFGLR